MTRLENWLTQAMRQLAQDSAAQVRTEICEHYESARDAALTAGATAEEADRQAVGAPGDPRTANYQYRQVLLTAAEARLLREGSWETRTICSRPWLKLLILAVPVAALATGTTMLLRRDLDDARMLLTGGFLVAFLLGGPLLPIYTPSRGRLYRALKWVAMFGGLTFAFGPNAWNWSWLLISCLWPFFWTEYTRESIRRKLPVANWPKHLYL